MLVDGPIRQKVVLLGDTVADDVEAALANVIRGASIRHREVLVRRVAMVAVVAATGGALWFGSISSYEGGERLQPGREANEREQPETGLKQRLQFQHNEFGGRRDSGVGSDGSLKRARRNPAQTRRSSRDGGSTFAEPTRSASRNDRAIAERETNRLPEASGSRLSHSERGPYQMPVVRPRLDPRQSCSVLGEGCVRFEAPPGDGFVRVKVTDDSGKPVLVRITQWDRHGRTIADPVLYCGGVSPKLELLPIADDVLVEVDDGNCPDGQETRPAGGVVDFLFFRG